MDQRRDATTTERWMFWASDNAAEAKFGQRPNGTDRSEFENVSGSGDTSNMRSMTALTPEQMRELAYLSTGDYRFRMSEVRTALRTAADQLEAVLAQVEALRMPFTTGKRLRAIHHNAAIDAVLAILTAETAPQEGRDD